MPRAKESRKRDFTNERCVECGKRVEALEFHPYIFCVLVKAGFNDPARELASFGYERIDRPE